MSTILSAGLSAGFADPVTDAQRCFRAVLTAMSQPGTLCPVAAVSPPPPLSPASAAVLLSLVDHETPVWLDPAASAAWDWIAFHCGAPRVTDLSEARFVLALTLPELASLNPGTHEMPETSATLILDVASFSHGQRFRLSGPGLREPVVVAIDGLPTSFLPAWRRNRGLYPLGVDLILCAGDTLTALPRTVTIEEA